MENLNMRKSVPYFIVLAISVALFIEGGQISSVMGGGDLLGPAFWPRLILLLAICVCVFELIFRLFFNMEGVEGLLAQVTHDMEQAAEETPEEITQANPLLLVAGVAMTLMYLWLMPTLGFTIATMIYMGSFIWLSGYQRKGIVITVSLLGTVILVFLFMKVVYVSLPLGTGFFRAVSTALLPLLGIH